MVQKWKAGIDIGSTTVKLVVLDEQGKMVYGEYRRHRSHTQATLCELLREAQMRIGDCNLAVQITGSGAISLGKA